MNVTLDDHRLREYRRDGYLVLTQLLPDEDFTALRGYFEDKLARLPHGARPEDMDVPHFTDPGLFRWLFHPAVLDLVEQIIGPNIALFSAHFFCKPPGDGKSVPWHEDAYYWRETITPSSDAITVWLALDPSTRANGCMRVIPGSHVGRERLYRGLRDDRSVFDEALDPTEYDPTQALPIELRPNECSIHAATLVHGSEANESPYRRCGFTMRYMSTAVRFNHEEVGDRHQIYLARGVDLAGNIYADPGKPNFELMERRGRKQNYLGKRVGGDRPGAG
ncbi:phytanoyl-CoA dioxygenase family protein [Amycolatopsis sacchari]|uniref:phytanoyl-CoA dioxygenase family protein n=1 Tax=Amycolatopsis sacchari TaxID=115433 RepID=UPI003D73BB25